jgi:hypothetical protein
MGAMNELKVLDPNGHTRTTWDTASPEEIENARRIYEDLMRRGYRAFRMQEGGRDGVPASGFDPRERETLLVPPIRAG